MEQGEYMTYEQWLRFQSFARTVLEPRNNVQLEELNKEICEPSSNRIGEPLMAFFASERWAKKCMFHHNTRNDERLAFELLCRVSFFAGCTANEDELDFKPEVKSILWTEIRRICTELEPHLPEHDRKGLLALLPVGDAVPTPTQEAETPAPVVVASKPAKRKSRNPSWVVEAMPYMKRLYASGKYRSNSVFYKALKNNVINDDSPFTLVKGELYCDKAGSTVAEGTLGNVWKTVRAP